MTCWGDFLHLPPGAAAGQGARPWLSDPSPHLPNKGHPWAESRDFGVKSLGFTLNHPPGLRMLLRTEGVSPWLLNPQSISQSPGAPRESIPPPRVWCEQPGLVFVLPNSSVGRLEGRQRAGSAGGARHKHHKGIRGAGGRAGGNFPACTVL